MTDAQPGSRQNLPKSPHMSSARRYKKQLSQGRPDLRLRQTQYVPAGWYCGVAPSLPTSLLVLSPSASPLSSAFCFFCCQGATQSHIMPFLLCRTPLLLSYHHQPCRIRQPILNKLRILLGPHFNLLHVKFLLGASTDGHLSMCCLGRVHVPQIAK